MRFVHAVVSLQPSAGVLAQLADEAQAAAELGLDWTVLVRHGAPGAGSSTKRSILAYIRLRLRFYAEVVRRSRNGEVVVLRHSAGDPLEFIATRLLRSPYVTVHHTLEEAELKTLGTWSARLQHLVERTLGRSVVRRASAIVAATPEVADDEARRAGAKPTTPLCVYPNGIRLQGLLPSPLDQRGDKPQLLFIADYFYRWHGLEELLKSMDDSDADGVLHVVGALPAHHVIKRTDRVVYHGQRSRAEIRGLQASTWLGLSSFRLDLKGMTQACTLKVREYLAAGIPVYAGHLDSALPPDFPYYVFGRPDWSTAVDVARRFRRISRQDVLAASREHVDKTLLLQRLHANLERALSRPTGLP